MRAGHGVLKQLGSAVVVGMGVRDDDVFHLPGIQAELFHPADDLILRCIVEEGFKNDDAVAADDGPGAVNFRSDEIKIVGDFRWLGIPRVLRGRSRSGSPRTACCSSPWSGSRWGRWRNAQPNEGA